MFLYPTSQSESLSHLRRRAKSFGVKEKWIAKARPHRGIGSIAQPFAGAKELSISRWRSSLSRRSRREARPIQADHEKAQVREKFDNILCKPFETVLAKIIVVFDPGTEMTATPAAMKMKRVILLKGSRAMFFLMPVSRQASGTRPRNPALATRPQMVCVGHKVVFWKRTRRSRRRRQKSSP